MRDEGANIMNSRVLSCCLNKHLSLHVIIIQLSSIIVPISCLPNNRPCKQATINQFLRYYSIGPTALLMLFVDLQNNSVLCRCTIIVSIVIELTSSGEHTINLFFLLQVLFSKIEASRTKVRLLRTSYGRNIRITEVGYCGAL